MKNFLLQCICVAWVGRYEWEDWVDWFDVVNLGSISSTCLHAAFMPTMLWCSTSISRTKLPPSLTEH